MENTTHRSSLQVESCADGPADGAAALSARPGRGARRERTPTARRLVRPADLHGQWNPGRTSDLSGLYLSERRYRFRICVYWRLTNASRSGRLNLTLRLSPAAAPTCDITAHRTTPSCRTIPPTRSTADKLLRMSFVTIRQR
ncbi:hypothetical protein EVAR_37332_1 [Eumeta japonica]|uniref:Uncharacterized protein n=1 Tax=Eumeta variegata TaxID=151549 RepID=A0A4C1X1R0_EUMVA|nr:hypothetical protein EVAR_37332_1 [Eumeta japonica]